MGRVLDREYCLGESGTAVGLLQLGYVVVHPSEFTGHAWDCGSTLKYGLVSNFKNISWSLLLREVNKS